MVRNFVLGMGSKLLDVFAGISLISVIIGGFITMGSAGFFSGLMVILFGSVGVVMFFYILYLLSDIQQNIRLMVEKNSSYS